MKPPSIARAAERAVVRRRWWILPVVAIVSAGVVVLAAIAWDWSRRPARQAVALPELPELAGWPAVLLERMQLARTRALADDTSLAGIEELGRLLHANGFAAEAATCWQLLHAEQPRHARWAYYLADLRRAANDQDGAAEGLTRTVRLDPEYAPAWLRLGDLEFKRGRLDAAETSYQRRLALRAGDPFARLGLARLALQRGRRDDARQQLEILVRDAPEFPPAHNLLAELLAASGDDAAAARERFRGSERRFREADDPWLEELIEWCFDYDRLCVRATRDLVTGHGTDGETVLQRAIALRPEALTAYELLGNAYLDGGDAARARATYEEGLRRATSARPSAKFYASLSRACAQTQQPDEAERVARTGLARLGREATLFDALGDALGARGEREAAVEAFRSAVECNPRDAGAHHKLAVALIAVRRLDDALDALHRSLANQPTFPPTLSLLGQIAIDSGRWAEAARYLQPLYDLNPELPEAREKMAFCHLRAGVEAEQGGDSAAAEQHYRAGLAIAHDHAELPARLGVLLLVQRRFADAIGPLETYHRGQPDNPQSALFLGQAYAAVGRRDEARQLLLRGAQLAERAGNEVTARHCQEILRKLP